MTASGDTVPPKSCPARVERINADGYNFNVRLSYKTLQGKLYNYDMKTPVESGDQVTWRQFDRATGAFCFANHTCENGNFVMDVDENNNPVKGCAVLMAAHEILWDQKSDGKKPDLGPTVCLASPVPAPDGPLLGFNDVDYECGNDTGSAAPIFSAYPSNRAVGNSVLGVCSTPLPGSLQNLRPAVNLIYGPSGDGSSTCWTKCKVPAYVPAPLSTNNGPEMRYYESITPEDLSRPFCDNSSGPGSSFQGVSQPVLDTIF